MVVSAGALLVRPEWVGFLGLAPIAIGVKQWLALRSAPTLKVDATGVLPISAVTLANGGDNIAVYAPLFARRSVTDIVLTLVVFAALLAVWCAAAYRLTRFPVVSSAFGRWGHRIAPLVLVGLGAYIFLDAGTVTYLIGRLQRP